MNLSVVIIWFNPDTNSVFNINKYSSLVKTVYIVDNSENNNIHLATQISNSIYIGNLKNLGIAKATNIGCERAFQDGFDWVMTMDQDSSWEITELKKFINFVENTKDKSIISFAPVHSNKTKSLVGELKEKSNKKIKSLIIYQSKVMASGNIISLKVWKEVNGFNNDLFIDEVDHEFCYKLIEAGYKICEFQDISMYHTLGNVKKTILPRPCKHSGVRLFYIFRNMLYIKDKFPNFFIENNYKSYMRNAIIQKIYELKIKDLIFIYKGKKAHKYNIYGSYENYYNRNKK